ncbi:MAG: glycosyltransferase family 4 protein [Chitinophagales bacterium]|nr:glycosyltransferase family 4 protein [Chitinophagaceae bacterium]MCB9065615.1 glycosyltransferase family 4 protein [Chitinophagales bacterium]
MKVLEVNFEKTWRGGERQTLYCMLGFRDRGVETAVVCRKGYPMDEKAQEQGFKTHALDGVFQLIAFLLTKAKYYDILHVETAGALTYCVFTKAFHRTKVVYTRRVDFVPNGFLTWVKYRLTDKLVAISTAIKQILYDFSRRSIVHISEIVQIKNLNEERAQNELHELGVSTDTKVIGTVAALEQHKDPLIMVEAIRLLKEKRNDFVFIHCGGGRLEESVKAKVQEYGLQDVYKMLGHKEQVEDFFTVFDVYVMSSEQEGLGSSVLDAFAYKVPVVSTNAGGLKDLLENDRGILCDIKQPNQLAGGIDTVLNNFELRTSLTSKAYEYVIHDHSMEYITEKYIDLFEKMLD